MLLNKKKNKIELLRKLLDAKPKFHGRENAGTEHYAIASDVLDWILDNLPKNAITLETGCGYSTVAFSIVSKQHIVISPFKEEHQVIRDWMKNNGGVCKHIEFVDSISQDYIYRLAKNLLLDMVLIDGDHAFPAPFIDWYYSADRIKEGGFVIVDDTQLTTGKILAEFLDQESERWEKFVTIGKTIIYKKITSQNVARGIPWIKQPFVKNLMDMK